MQQTYAHVATLQNNISMECEEALTLTQGHSRETANQYYILRDMEKAAKNASGIHKRLHGEFTVPNINIPHDADEEFRPGRYSPYDLCHIFIDNDHVSDCSDEPSQKRIRLAWSIEEEVYIAKWIEDYVASSTYNITARINWKKLEAHIKNDKATNIFLDEHIKHTKLMECAKRMAKRLGVSIQSLTKSLLE